MSLIKSCIVRTVWHIHYSMHMGDIRKYYIAILFFKNITIQKKNSSTAMGTMGSNIECIYSKRIIYFEIQLAILKIEERTCLALPLPCHFSSSDSGHKNGSCAAGTPPASQGGWIFGISVFHHCGWHHEGQVRDGASLYWCFSNPNCDFFCSRRRTPPSPPSTPS